MKGRGSLISGSLEVIHGTRLQVYPLAVPREEKEELGMGGTGTSRSAPAMSSLSLSAPWELTYLFSA